MKKTIVTLTTLASLATVGTHTADAAAYGKVNANTTSYSTSYNTYNQNFNASNLNPVSFDTTYTTSNESSSVVRSFSQNAERQYKPAATTSVNNNVASVALSIAAGKSYVFGANSATAVDCSSFAQQVMAAMGKSIPRTTYAQMAAGTPVSNPQPGDLVFFNGGSHVGVYIGNGQMVDALNPYEGVGQRAVSYIDGSITGYYRY
ncbi:C40 family peptidase [Macrococcus sp. DPC7161]|uniref:C40 family peptidase n=1 Tax=Macrococcus sp. DPC7161 TaxID=2507060 RepID=UPI00100B24F3|nr:C40 family peptidase [Macrococcus sp. DPC7161]RXK17919.1 peptidoglycan endopeptidase [Macrococcus sp. DPC7161]